MKTLIVASALLATLALASAQETPAAGRSTETGSAMATVAKVGAKAPDFDLTDTAGKTHKLSDYAGKIVVLEWFNPDCPVTQAFHKGDSVMGKTYAGLRDKNVVWLAINSSAAGKQGNGLERNQKAVAELKVAYPVLLDEAGKVGRTYQAKTTPHMFVIDTKGVLAYAGAIDNSQEKGDKNYVAEAVRELSEGKAVTTAETKSFGCSVKYGE